MQYELEKIAIATAMNKTRMDLPALFDSEDSPVRHPFSKSTTLEMRSKVWKLMYLVEAR